MVSDQLPNCNPREVLVGWRLQRRTVWVLLALYLCLPASAWLPGDWMTARALLAIVGCVAGGLLIASRAAVWQRINGAPQELDTPEGAACMTLTGWRYHLHAASVLLALLAGGLIGMAWFPKEWVVWRGAAFVLGTIAAGVLAARDAAIWERVDETVKA